MTMSPRTTFRATVELGGKTATGLRVPDDVVAALGTAKRPAVHVTVAGHTYRTTVAPMGGAFWIPLSAENRTAAGVAAGDGVEVVVALDTAQRTVTLPRDVEAVLAADGEAQAFFGSLSYSHRKEWVRWIEEAKKPETRTARIERTIAAMHAGQRTH